MLTDQEDQHPTPPTESPAVPTPVGVLDYEAQRDWENFQVTRGIWRYQRSLQRELKDGKRVNRAISELEPGQKIADEVIEPLVERIRTRQDAAAEAMADPNLKKTPDDFVVLLAIPAEVMGVVTILSALSRTDPASLQTCALDVGTKIMHELERIVWRDREKQAAKDREEAGAEWEPNLYELMVKRNDRVDERVFRKWSKKAAQFVQGDWTHATRLRIGNSLLGMLIEVDGWFEIDVVRDGIKTKPMFQLTDTARAWIAQRHNQNELARPFLLPMICEPRDYVYLPKQTQVVEEEPEAAEAA